MSSKVKRFLSVCPAVGLVLILTVFVTLLFWWIIQMFLPEIRYWHILGFAIVSECVCLYICWTRKLRERSKVMRIIEYIVGWALIIALVFITTIYFAS